MTPSTLTSLRSVRVAQGVCLLAFTVLFCVTQIFAAPFPKGTIVTSKQTQRTYVIEKVLGHGAFGTTYLATMPDGTGKFVVKIYNAKAKQVHGENIFNGSKNTQDAQRTSGDLIHMPEILDFGTFKIEPSDSLIAALEEDFASIYRFIEGFEGEVLSDLIKLQFDDLQPDSVMRLQASKQFISKLIRLNLDLAEHGLAHNDLKARNLIIVTGKSAKSFTLGDAIEGNYELWAVDVDSLTKIYGDSSRIHTPGHRPPESFVYQANTGPLAISDVYSAGATVYRTTNLPESAYFDVIYEALPNNHNSFQEIPDFGHFKTFPQRIADNMDQLRPKLTDQGKRDLELVNDYIWATLTPNPNFRVPRYLSFLKKWFPEEYERSKRVYSLGISLGMLCARNTWSHFLGH